MNSNDLSDADDTHTNDLDGCELTIAEYEKLAQQGNIDSMAKLASNYYYGNITIEKDYEKAFKYASMAAELGNALGMRILGSLYQEGNGVIKDATQAIAWFLNAAKQNDVPSQYTVGMINLLSQNDKEAFKYFEMAATNGFAFAQHKMGFMYHEGLGTNQNILEAIRWYRLAADQGVSDSMFNLGMMYLDGDGIEQDRKKAKELIDKSISYGNLDAILFDFNQQNEVAFSKNSKYVKSFNVSINSICDDQSMIYHYTSPLGLEAIINSETLRFSDCQFMNDKTEYTQIIEPLTMAARRTFDKVENENKSIDCIRDLLDIFGSAISEVLTRSECIQSEVNSTGKELSFSDSQYYVFCASEEKDSLSMWNYYIKGNGYQGYNIAFTVKDLVKNICNLGPKYKEIRLYYGHVFYKENEQIEILEELLLNACNSLVILWGQKENCMDNNNYSNEEFNKRFFNIAYTYANVVIENCRLFMKHVAFSDENEYRLVLKMPLDYKSKIKSKILSGCRMDHGLFIPYCDVKFDKKNTISKITTAPMVEHELVASGIFRCLNQRDYRNFSVKNSEIPIRY